MTVRKVLLAGDPVLRKKTETIEDFNLEKSLITDLRDTLIEFKEKKGLGRGIAAPQIGISKKALYIITDEFEGELINPKIISHSSKESVWWDSCFSYNAAIFAKVKRWKEIEIEYFDLSGNKHKLEAEGSLSELLQHEIDHLDGILFMDRKKEEGEWLIMREEWEKLGRPSRVEL